VVVSIECFLSQLRLIAQRLATLRMIFGSQFGKRTPTAASVKQTVAGEIWSAPDRANND